MTDPEYIDPDPLIEQMAKTWGIGPYTSGGNVNFLKVETLETKMTLNYPKSWLARRIWRFFGVSWERL